LQEGPEQRKQAKGYIFQRGDRITKVIETLCCMSEGGPEKETNFKE
jgi:hypothetical protein